MKTEREWNIIVAVTACQGSQTFRVMAESDEHAREIFKAQGGEFVEESIGVLDFEVVDVQPATGETTPDG